MMLFREHAVVCGYIKDIGWCNLEEGIIIGKLVSTTNDKPYSGKFKQRRIAKDGVYKISHVGIFVGVVEIDDEMYVVVRQSTKSLGGVVETIFSTEKMDSLGWNVWMWPKEVLPEGYDVRDIR